MTIEQTGSTGVAPRREVGRLRLPEGGAHEATPAAGGDSATIDADTRALLAAMRRIATVEADGGGVSPERVSALAAAVRAGRLGVDPEALARAILRDEEG